MRKTSLLLIFIFGCADDIASQPVPPSDSDDILGEDTSKVTTVRNDDGSYTTVIDSTSTDSWTAFDFDRGVEIVEPGDDSWDVAGQRFHLRLSSGLTGRVSDEVQIMPLGNVELAAVTGDATGTWVTDLPDGDDINELPDYALEQGDGWYDYDPSTHVLTARPVTWLLRTGAGALRALRIESYYDDAGTAAKIKLRWIPLQDSQFKGESQ
jgi:HmuY protein